MKPNFNHIDAWVFDLDNTLYPASTNLFAAIDTRMGEFIATLLKVDAVEALRIQKSYFRDYGTTLRGLMVNHAIEPDVFLDYVHAIDVGVLTPDPGLQSVLGKLQGRKIIFTNGSSLHAEKVMTRLGVTDHFEAIFDVADADYLSKPDPAAYHALVARHGLSPRATTIFEDLSRNLAPAAELMMHQRYIAGPCPA